jgi:hypothetical protein
MPEGYNVQVDPEGSEIDNLVVSVNGVKPDESGNVEIKAGGGVSTEEINEAVEAALTEAKESGAFKGEKGEAGTSVTITSIKESSIDSGTNTVTFSDGKVLKIKNGSSGGSGTGGGGISSDQLIAAVEEALQDAKDSGEFDGADGHTPVKGTDYYTEADKAEMVSLVLTALPTWSGGNY